MSRKRHKKNQAEKHLINLSLIAIILEIFLKIIEIFKHFRS